MKFKYVIVIKDHNITFSNENNVSRIYNSLRNPNTDFSTYSLAEPLHFLSVKAFG